jgi:hypothetical protein
LSLDSQNSTKFEQQAHVPAATNSKDRLSSDALSAESAKLSRKRSDFHATGSDPLDTPPRSPHVAFYDDNQVKDAAKNGAHSSASPNDDARKRSDASIQSAQEFSTEKQDDESSTATADDGTSLGDQTTDVTSGQGVQSTEKSRNKDRIDTSVPVVSINDNASSPSSTAGAYSTSTPKPPQQSPDTSPEAEPLPSSSRNFDSTRNDHSAVTSPTAVKRISDDSTSPEAQLRMEEAQANRPHGIKQDNEDEASREQTNGDAPNPGSGMPIHNGTHATAGSSSQADRIGGTSTDVDMVDASLQDPTRNSSIQQANRSGTFKKPSLDLTPSRMTTRVSSGAIRQKSVSEILGGSPRKSPQTQYKSPNLIARQCREMDPTRRKHRLWSSPRILISHQQKHFVMSLKAISV